MLQRDADLLHLWTEFQRAAPGAAKTRATEALQGEIANRAKVDADVRAAVVHLLGQPEFLSGLQVSLS